MNEVIRGDPVESAGHSARNRAETTVLESAPARRTLAQDLDVAVTRVGNDPFHELEYPPPVPFKDSVERRTLVQKQSGDAKSRVVTLRRDADPFDLLRSESWNRRADIHELNEAYFGSGPRLRACMIRRQSRSRRQRVTRTRALLGFRLIIRNAAGLE